MNEDFGYGEVEQVVKQTSLGGKYLKLEYGHDYFLRIASRPRYTIRHWQNNKPFACEGENCQYCKSSDKEVAKKNAQWSWIVIDREDSKVKILQAPNSVAMSIRDLSKLVNPRTKSPVWGDPTTFDITLNKEKKGDSVTKYSVQPDPDSRHPLTDEEKAMVKEANFDLEKEVENSSLSEHVGNYGDKAIETAPDEAVDAEDIPDGLGEAEAVGEDDLPF